MAIHPSFRIPGTLLVPEGRNEKSPGRESGGHDAHTITSPGGGDTSAYNRVAKNFRPDQGSGDVTPSHLRARALS